MNNPILCKAKHLKFPGHVTGFLFIADGEDDPEIKSGKIDYAMCEAECDYEHANSIDITTLEVSFDGGKQWRSLGEVKAALKAFDAACKDIKDHGIDDFNCL